ncbi:MAG: TIGR02147 family protein [Chitinivibrionales bacterium]|nr:TIGR02147 family protein [Chitinivibrionales bacterium]
MVELFNYTDYREFLRDCYEAHKQEKSWFSLRLFGSKIGLDAAYLLRIMQKVEHLSAGKAACIGSYLKFTPQQTGYFEAMVRFTRAKTESEASGHFEKMMQLKGVQPKYLDPLQYEYYKKWYYSAILSVIGFYDVSTNYRELGKKLAPPISAAMAREALELLERLGLIRRSAIGVFERTNQHISTGPQIKSLAVRNFQKETIKLSAEAIDRFPAVERDVSTVTVNMRHETLEDIREILRHCRQAIIQRVGEDDQTDCAYQVNMQVFPLSDVSSTKTGQA